MSCHAGNVRPEVEPFIPADTQTLLDVGCSDGLFAEYIQRQRPGITVDGVEPDPVTAAAAERRVRNLYQGEFPDTVPADAQYDCITFLDCLEHIVEPWDALRAASQHLTQRGVLVASLPNIRYAYALNTLLRHKDWPFEKSGIFDRTHVRFFTEVSMRRLFESSGYCVEACVPINKTRALKARALALILGSDVFALQFLIVARPVEGANSSVEP